MREDIELAGESTPGGLQPREHEVQIHAVRESEPGAHAEGIEVRDEARRIRIALGSCQRAEQGVGDELEVDPATADALVVCNRQVCQSRQRGQALEELRLRDMDVV